MLPRSILLIAVALIASWTLPRPAEAQIFDKVKKAAKRAVEDESAGQIDRLLRDAIRCALDDPICAERAEEEGKPVIYTDDEGNVITDDEGTPITDHEEAAEKAGAADKPGEGVWANYDFVPGEDVLFYEDYSDDNVGDFPRRLEFINGNWEVVEWQDRRFLRNTGPRHAAFAIELPETLPERFTIEFDVHFPHGNQSMIVATAPPTTDGGNWADLEGNFFKAARNGSGLDSREKGAPESLNRVQAIMDRVVPFRMMVDGSYAKVYVGEQRVANVPNATLPRSSTLYFENTYFADSENPMYIGPIRVAAGGADLYDALEADGRVATRGIQFAVNSARIRPESTPTLKEIGAMLEEHPDLSLSIEGHTDSDGDDSYNKQLSEKRAAAVKEFLVQEYGIDASRLETAGHGESQPVADNGTPEGKQENRRVELIKLN